MTDRDAPGHLKVGYIMSRFPKITETFILFEMRSVQEHGVTVEVYPLLQEHTPVIHPEARPLVERAHFRPFVSRAIIRSNLHYLRHRPRAYLGALWTLLRANWGNLNFFLGAIGIFPKSVDFAHHMSAHGIDHVHAHFASHPAASAFIIHRLTGIPFSFTGHGTDLNRYQQMLCEKVREAAFVVPISRYFETMILDRCGSAIADRLTVIHCGVDTELLQPRPVEPIDQMARPLSILCIGTLHEVKGQRYLIEACDLLRQHGAAFECHLVGDGPDEAALMDLVAHLGLDEQVRFHGRLAHADVRALLRTADVLVTPSVPTPEGRKEGIPVVLMEAMACGVPVVATDISGIPELVEHERTGLLTAPGAVAAIADAIERLTEDAALRQHIVTAARAKVVDEFDLATNATLLVERFHATAS